MATTSRRSRFRVLPSRHARRAPVLAAAGALLLVAVSIGTGCPAPYSAPPAHRGDQECGVTTGWIWRPTWWNFAARGESYASCELFDEAIQDFRWAIERRAADQRHARTYGMHFLDDYFPHRELGIALFRQGKLDEAEHELVESLGSEPSARAKFYLNETRRESLRRRGAGALPGPVIALDGVASFATRETSVRISGRVHSAQRVASLEIGGKRELVELAEPELPFAVEVPVDPGENAVRIATTDLLGNASEAIVRVTGDRQGPVMAIQSIDLLTGGAIEIVASAHDPSGVATLEIAGIAQTPSATGASSVRLRIARPADDRVRFVTTDRLGNETRGTLVLTADQAASPASERRVLVASLDSDLPPADRAASGRAAEAAPAGSRGGAVASGLGEIHWKLGEKLDAALDRDPPLVRIDGLDDGQTLYLDRVLVSGSVSDDSRVTSIELDQLVAEIHDTTQGPMPAERASIPATHERLDFTPGRQVFFSSIVALGDGPNVVRIVATDAAGKRTERTVGITRIRPAIRDPRVRLAVAPMPFRDGDGIGDLSERLEDFLVDGLVDQRRYRIVDRETVAESMREKSLVLADLVDPDAAIDVARTTPAEAILVGRAYRRGASLEAWVKLVDTETSETLTLSDVYGENLQSMELGPLMSALAQKIALSIPVVEAPVVAAGNDEITIARGASDRLKPNLRVALFRAVAGESGGAAPALAAPSYQEIARGRTRSVDASLTRAELVADRSAAAAPRAGDLLVIR
ncbi:MAG: CsgG/HfaB family protein [bacterium]